MKDLTFKENLIFIASLITGAVVVSDIRKKEFVKKEELVKEVCLRVVS